MRVCPNCGAEAPKESVFCPLCGSRFGAFRVIPDQAHEKPIGSLRNDIKANIEQGRTTDKRISTIWSVIPLLILIPTMVSYLWVLVFLSLNTDFGYWDSDVYYFFRSLMPPILRVLFAVLAGILLYRLLKRLNRHMDREESLRANVMAYLRALAQPSGREIEMINELLRMSAYDGQASTYEKRLNPATWAWGVALLFAIPTVIQFAIYIPLTVIGEGSIWFVFALLFYAVVVAIGIGALVSLIYLALHITRTAYTHELRWRGFATSTVAALRRLGYYVETPEHLGNLKERSVAVYAVLTVLTLGFFSIYWLYAVIDDPNKHFDEQMQFEMKLWDLVQKTT